MLRSSYHAILGTIALAFATSAAQAQVAFPSARPGYTPNFKYQYGYGVSPSYYYSGPAPVVTPQVKIYTIEFRRNHWDYWHVFARTYNIREAQNYAIYLRNLGFQARVHDHLF